MRTEPLEAVGSCNQFAVPDPGPLPTNPLDPVMPAVGEHLQASISNSAYFGNRARANGCPELGDIDDRIVRERQIMLCIAQERDYFAAWAKMMCQSFADRRALIKGLAKIRAQFGPSIMEEPAGRSDEDPDEDDALPF